MYRIVTEWDAELKKFPAFLQDTYFYEGYVKLYESKENKAVCYIYEEDDKCFLFPFLRREFFLKGQLVYDFETAYGYGGPIYNNSDMSFLINSFETFYKYCARNNYIAGLIRFHPIFENYLGFTSIGELLFDRNTIAIDLTLTTDEIWTKELNGKNRNIINKAIKSGLKFFVDEDFSYLEEFIRLYNITMDKVNADKFFYFQPEFYHKLKTHLKNSFLGCVEFENKIISSAVFFYSNQYGHYHLSGSDKNYLKLNPNNFLLFATMNYMKNLGLNKFHLGGGSNSDPENSLFLFKRKFSQDTYNFYIGKTIFNAQLYKTICSEWNLINKPEKVNLYKNHLLKYKY